MATADGTTDRCDYCRLPIPKSPVPLDRDGERYEFCSVACRDALTESDRVFTAYHGHRRFQPGVSVLTAALPEGIPRNSFVLLTDQPGTRTEALQTELAWRALQRGEPVVFVTLLEPPVSLVQQFASLSWNVLPYLEDGQLQVVDCFTYRVDDRDRMAERLNDWNTHLAAVVEQSCTHVRDPSNMRDLRNQIGNALERSDMEDRGIVVIDSLTELGTLVQPVQAYDFVKTVRADVCKGRFVPVFAGATVSGMGDNESFPLDLAYMADGVVDLQLTEEVVEDVLIKRLRVRKLNGVLVYPEWHVYEYAAGTGIVSYDPSEEIDADQSAADTGETESADGGSNE